MFLFLEDISPEDIANMKRITDHSTVSPKGIDCNIYRSNFI